MLYLGDIIVSMFLKMQLVMRISGPLAGANNSECCLRGACERGDMNLIHALGFSKSCLSHFFQAYCGGILIFHTFKIRYIF